MKIIEPSYSIEDRRGMSISGKIEQAGRIAYKSEDKLTENSAVPFCRKLFSKGHLPVFEFANIHFYIEPKDHDMELFEPYLDQFMKCMYPQKYVTISTTNDKSGEITGFIISGTARAFLESLDARRCKKDNEMYSVLEHIMLSLMVTHSDFPVAPANNFAPLYTHEDFKCEIVTPKFVMDNVHPERIEDHLMCAVHFIVNRAVTHELVRHRPCSFLQESQRYCRYDQEKFGEEVTFISPSVFFKDKESVTYAIWEGQMNLAEAAYLELLTLGHSPQAARTVLPNSCKTEIMMYCTIAEWKHIFKLRDSSAAEPSMQQVMKPLHAEFFEPHNVLKWE